MALIACPECTKQISTLAATCPHCGYPMQANAATQTTAANPQLRNCPDCGGSGKQEVFCVFCNGTGRFSGTCNSCSGRGYFYNKCERCIGTGQLTFEQFDTLQHEIVGDERKHAEVIQRQFEAEVKRIQEAEKRKAEEHARWLADAPKREAQEQAKRREAEAKQKADAEAERLRIQKAREAAGCCVNCGLRLGFWDKLHDNKHHVNCVVYTAKQTWESSNMGCCIRCRCAVDFTLFGTADTKKCVKCGSLCVR